MQLFFVRSLPLGSPLLATVAQGQISHAGARSKPELRSLVSNWNWFLFSLSSDEGESEDRFPAPVEPQRVRGHGVSLEYMRKVLLLVPDCAVLLPLGFSEMRSHLVCSPGKKPSFRLFLVLVLGPWRRLREKISVVNSFHIVRFRRNFLSRPN